MPMFLCFGAVASSQFSFSFRDPCLGAMSVFLFLHSGEPSSYVAACGDAPVLWSCGLLPDLLQEALHLQVLHEALQQHELRDMKSRGTEDYFVRDSFGLQPPPSIVA